jgi:hypothetical protein
MCYSAEVSIISYIIGMYGCYLLYNRKYYTESLFYMSVIQMQLVEFFLHLINTCNNWNILVTDIGIIINHIEPLTLYYGIIFFNKKKLDLNIHLLMDLYILVASSYSTSAILSNSCTLKDYEYSNHLIWKWNELHGCVIIYTLFIVVLSKLSIHGLDDGNFHNWQCIISYLISLIVYGLDHFAGSFWCFIAVSGPYVLLLRKKHLELSIKQN